MVKDAFNPSNDSPYSTVSVKPTEIMLGNAYSVFNSELFNGELPSIELKTVSDAVHDEKAWIDFKRTSGGNIIPSSISLNDGFRMSLHDWLEHILHLCVHVLDVKRNGDSFNLDSELHIGHYNTHGDFLHEYSERFKSIGFDIEKQELIYDSIDEKTDRNIMQTRASNAVDTCVLVHIIGDKSRFNDGYLRISRKYLEVLEHLLLDGQSNPASIWEDIDKVEYYTTDNGYIGNMTIFKPSDSIRNFHLYSADFVRSRISDMKLESEFVPSECYRDTLELKNRFASRVNRLRLSERIFRTVLGRGFATIEGYISKGFNMIHPSVKSSTGSRMTFVISQFPDKHGYGKLYMDDNLKRMYISKSFVDGLIGMVGNVKGSCMDDSGIVEDYYCSVEDMNYNFDNQTVVPSGTNITIDRYIERELERENGYDTVDRLRKAVIDAVNEFCEHPNPSSKENEALNEVYYDENGTVMDDSYRMCDIYARSIWRIYGVIDVNRNDDCSVTVSMN